MSMAVEGGRGERNSYVQSQSPEAGGKCRIVAVKIYDYSAGWSFVRDPELIF